MAKSGAGGGRPPAARPTTHQPPMKPDGGPVTVNTDKAKPRSNRVRPRPRLPNGPVRKQE